MTGNEDLGKWKEKVDDPGIPLDTKGQSLKGIIEIVRKNRITQVPVPNGIPHKVYKMLLKC